MLAWPRRLGLPTRTLLFGFRKRRSISWSGLVPAGVLIHRLVRSQFRSCSGHYVAFFVTNPGMTAAAGSLEHGRSFRLSPSGSFITVRVYFAGVTSRATPDVCDTRVRLAAWMPISRSAAQSRSSASRGRSLLNPGGVARRPGGAVASDYEWLPDSVVAVREPAAPAFAGALDAPAGLRPR
jgi:hypothetical protein